MWNRRYYYREKIKKAACWALIIILLPYIVTVFVNGPKIVTASKVDEMTIDVKGGGKMPVEKYCIGILARDMPAEYEEEALKAQAILVRTEVYRAIRDAGERILDRETDEVGVGDAICRKLPQVKKCAGIHGRTSAIL